MIPRRLRRPNRAVLRGSFFNTETVQIPIVNLLKDHEERGNKRLEDAIHRMVEVQQEFKAELKMEHAGFRAELKMERAELRAELNTLIEKNTQLLRSEMKAERLMNYDWTSSKK